MTSSGRVMAPETSRTREPQPGRTKEKAPRGGGARSGREAHIRRRGSAPVSPWGRGSLQRRASLVPDDGNMAAVASGRKCRPAIGSVAGGDGGGWIRTLTPTLSRKRERESRRQDAASVEQRQRDQDLDHGGRNADREAVAERRAERRRRHGGGGRGRQGAGGGMDLSRRDGEHDLLHAAPPLFLQPRFGGYFANSTLFRGIFEAFKY